MVDGESSRTRWCGRIRRHSKRLILVLTTTLVTSCKFVCLFLLSGFGTCVDVEINAKGTFTYEMALLTNTTNFSDKASSLFVFAIVYCSARSVK